MKQKTKQKPNKKKPTKKTPKPKNPPQTPISFDQAYFVTQDFNLASLTFGVLSCCSLIVHETGAPFDFRQVHDFHAHFQAQQ